jgi:hypothetical protein
MTMRALTAAALLLPALLGCGEPPASPRAADKPGAAPAPPAADKPAFRPADGPDEAAPRPERVEARPVFRGAAPDEEAVFRLPDDEGGRLVARLLTPHLDAAPEASTTSPRHRSAALGVEEPLLPLPPVAMLVPRLPPERFEQKLRPRLVLEETLDDLGEVKQPRAAPLPEGQRARQPRQDVTLPAPLPVLAVPLPDRASLDDPTVEASFEAALRAAAPQRNRPVPFQKVVLPDPFENRRAVNPPQVPPEDGVPGTGAAPRPQRP